MTATSASAERLQHAHKIAVEAGQLTLEYFQQDNFQVERKSDNSPVTIADRRAEQLLRQRIAEKFPDDGIVGEEFDDVAAKSDFRWILDPIDGTKSFISGVPFYGTLIGIERGDSCEVGVIYIPGLDECVYAGVGQGAWYCKGDAEPRRAQVSSCSRLEDGLFLTSQVDTFAEREAAEAFERLQQTAYITRTWGDCYGYLLIATGRAEAMVDPAMHLWDAAALKPILEEAGGTFTAWNGEPTIHSGDGVGTNGHVADQVLAITRQYPQPS